MKVHRVEEGQCLTGIAVENGFADRNKILDHPDNADLKKARPNPNLLRPGDRVVIPDFQIGEHDGATSRRHRLVLDLPTKELRVVLRAHDGTPLSGQSYTLEVGREMRSGTTDGDGKLVEHLRISMHTATLTVGERIFVLRLSSLGPVGDEEDDEVRDVQARLHNLGYDVGRIDGVYGHRTRAALAVFQAEHDLEVNGEPDAATRQKLEEEHGC